MIKREIRVLGISCARPHPRPESPTQVVGVVYRGNRWLEGVMRTTIRSSAADLTPGIAKMVADSPHFPQVRVIALDELITKSGRYVDIRALSKKSRLLVIAVLRQKILIKRLSKSLAKLSRRSLEAFSKLPCRNWKMAGRTFFVYSAGVGDLDLVELVSVCASREGVPEAARVARIATSSLERLLGKGGF